MQEDTNEDHKCVDWPEGDCRLAQVETSLRTRGEVHVEHGVGNEKTSNAIPRPALHPESSGDKGKHGLDTPGHAGVGYNDHGHVDSVALLEEYRDDPESTRREDVVGSLVTVLLVDPEDFEHGVEVY